MKYCDGAGQAGFVDCDPYRGQCDKCMIERLEEENESLRRDAERYRVLRRADIDTIQNGGLFVGLTPENIVINGTDLDYRCDALISSPENPS